jgi:hypothetical protein
MYRATTWLSPFTPTHQLRIATWSRHHAACWSLDTLQPHSGDVVMTIERCTPNNNRLFQPWTGAYSCLCKRTQRVTPVEATRSREFCPTCSKMLSHANPNESLSVHNLKSNKYHNQPVFKVGRSQFNRLDFLCWWEKTPTATATRWLVLRYRMSCMVSREIRGTFQDIDE